MKISKERLGPRCRQRTKSTVGLEERVKRFPFQQFVSELPVVAAEKVLAAGEKTPCGVPRPGFAATSRLNWFAGLPPGIRRNSSSGKRLRKSPLAGLSLGLVFLVSRCGRCTGCESGRSIQYRLEDADR